MPKPDEPDFNFLNPSSSNQDSAILESDSAPVPEPEPDDASDPEPAAEIAGQAAQSAAPEPEPDAEPDQESENVPADSPQPANQSTPQSTSQSAPAWIDNAVHDAPHDSSTRFASALNEDAPAQGDAPKLFSQADAPDENATESSTELPTESILSDTAEPSAAASGSTNEDTVFDASLQPTTENRVDSQAATPAGEETSYDAEQSTLPASRMTNEDLSAATPPDPESVNSADEQTTTDISETDNSQVADDNRSSETSPISSSEAATSPPTPAAAAITTPAPKVAVKKKSSLPFLLLVSYASAMTLFCIYLLMQSYAGKPHELESLPDLKPPTKNGEVAYQLVPEAAGMPPGHTLQLGKSKRYGNILLTPLKVTREPLEFSHYTNDANQQRPPADDVLKLWLKFENVSDDQTFAPIDRQLLLTRVLDPQDPSLLRSNQNLVPQSEKGNLEQTMLLYDLERDGDWNFANIDDEPVLKPGESIELYLPSAQVDSFSFDEPLIWRVQFRKGYHPQSYRGVTTLIEVKIKPDEIESA